MTVKEKLEAYRRKKRREETMNSIKGVMKNMLTWNRNNNVKSSIEESTEEEQVRLHAVVLNTNSLPSIASLRFVRGERRRESLKNCV